MGCDISALPCCWWCRHHPRPVTRPLNRCPALITLYVITLCDHLSHYCLRRCCSPGPSRAPPPGTHRSPALRRSPGHGRATTFSPSPPARALLPLRAGRDVIPARRIGVASQSGAVQSARSGAAQSGAERRGSSSGGGAAQGRVSRGRCPLSPWTKWRSGDGCDPLPHLAVPGGTVAVRYVSGLGLFVPPSRWPGCGAGCLFSVFLSCAFPRVGTGPILLNIFMT